MAILDNAIWLTSGTGHAENGTTVITEGGNSTTVTGTFTANAWDASQNGYNVSGFGAFGVSDPISAHYEFSNPVENLTFDLEHVNDSGTSYDDQWTIYAYDENGTLIDAADVIAGLSGLVDETIITNPDGSVTIEADGSTSNSVTISLPGPVSELELILDNGPDAPLSGGTGISDFSFTVPVLDTDRDGVADIDDLDDDNDGILDTEEGLGSTTPSTITITFDGDEYASGETTWTLYDASGVVIASDATTSSTTEITNVSVTDLGQYTFVVDDTFGDGLAGTNPASYSIAIDGVTVHSSLSNENFGTQQTVNFDVQATMTFRDTDNDGIADHLDLDSDDDGITDNVEAQSTEGYIAPTGLDSDNDGLDNAYEGTGGLQPVDTDGDGTDDYIDTDADGDGILDSQETGFGVSQAAIDASGDADRDGIKDVVDNVVGWDVNDTNVTGLGAFTLADSDNDTAADGTDADGMIRNLDYRDNTLPDGTVQGTAGADSIDAGYTGDPNGDRIDSNDAILAGHTGNDDLVYGYGGNDTITSGYGSDTVYGGEGVDTIYGGDGGDTLYGGSDNATATGGTETAGLNFKVFHLGSAAEIDTVDGNAVTENDTALLGSYGAPGDELYTKIQDATATDPDGNTRINNGDAETAEIITINGTDHLIDTGVVYNATVTFTDGSTGTITAVVMQTEDGNVYLMPEVSNNADHTLLTSKPIESISLDSVSVNYTNITANRMDGDYALPGDTDTSGDVLDGGAGNDTIYGGDGADTILDSAGNDYVEGGEGKDRFDYTTITGDDTVVGGELNDTTPTDSGDKLDAHWSTDTLTVTFTGDEAGTMTDGTDTVTFSEIEHIMAGQGNDTIDASASTVGQILDGGEGADTIQGSSGDDIIAMGQTQDFSATDGDNDTLVLVDGFGNDSIEGFETPTDLGGGAFAGNDQLDVTSLTDSTGDPVNVNDVTVTDTNGDGSGDAILVFPNGESITLWGVNISQVNSDAQLIAMGIPPAPDFTVEGTAGDDIIDSGYVGDPEGDMIDNSDHSDGSNDDLVEAGAGNDQINAGTGADTVYAGTGDDLVYGGFDTSSDTLFGEDGNDSLYGYDGNDTIYGGAGNDSVDGDGGDDTLFGDGGNDTVILDAGNDLAYGGTGDDAIFASSGDNTVYGGSGSDEIYLGTGNDTIDGGTEADTIYGGDANDTIQLNNNFGADVIFGGEDLGDTDTDTLDLSAVTDDLTVDLTNANPETGTVSDGSATATFSEIEAIRLGAGQDTLVLADGSGSDRVEGFQAPTPDGDGTFTGVDMLDVSALSDGTRPVNVNDVTVTDDGSGNAVLTFPNGENLTLVGITPTEADNPYYLNAIGIPFSDGIVEGTAAGDLIIGSYTGDPDGDMIDGNDAHLPGETGNDDIVYGYGGNDYIQSDAGNDEVYGGTGNDTVVGGSGDDNLYGGDGRDSLYGGTGADTVSGDAGDDLMTGLAGADTLYGGTGNDEIRYAGGDVAEGGDGDDLFTADTVNFDGTANTITGGEGAETTGDTLSTGPYAGSSTLDLTAGGTGADPESGTLIMGADSVTFTEIENFQLGAGDDSATGSSGNDNIDLGAGADTINAGAGNDTISLGDNGAGSPDGDADVVVLQDGFGNDLITHFDAPTANGDGTFTGIDTFDVTGLTNGTRPVNVTDVAVTDAGGGNTLLTFPNGESVILAGVDHTVADDPLWLNAIGIPFTDGTVEGTAGADTIGAGYLGDPDGDLVDAGDAHLPGDTGDDDLIYAYGGDDSVHAGAGNDEVYGGDGNDLLQGGAGEGTFDGGAGDDTIYTGSGNDTSYGGSGNDVVGASIGSDEAYGGDGNDTLSAGGFAGVGDTLSGDAGDDTLYGGLGNDTLLGGDDQDIIFGGGGDSVDGGAGGTDFDTLYLGEFGTTITYDSGDPESGTVEFADGSILTFTDIENVVPCFTPGTRIRTATGDLPVESLKPGDLVLTRDAGLQPLAWVGKRHVTASKLAENPALNPILIRQDAIGPCQPNRDMMVSPQHRMLVANASVQLWLGVDEVLVKAKDMTHKPGIEQGKVAEVTYIHLMFEHHQIVLADGAWSESFQPGDMVGDSAEQEMFEEIVTLFPELANSAGRNTYLAARLSAKKHEAQLIC